MEVRPDISKPTPFIYLGSESWTHSYTYRSKLPPIHILHVVCGTEYFLGKNNQPIQTDSRSEKPKRLLRKIILRRQSTFKAIDMLQLRKRGPFIYQTLKKIRPFIYFPSWKRGLFGLHSRTTPYIGSYPHTHTHTTTTTHPQISMSPWIAITYCFVNLKTFSLLTYSGLTVAHTTVINHMCLCSS